jgi:hypothetical protein
MDTMGLSPPPTSILHATEYMTVFKNRKNNGDLKKKIEK